MLKIDEKTSAKIDEMLAKENAIRVEDEHPVITRDELILRYITEGVRRHEEQERSERGIVSICENCGAEIHEDEHDQCYYYYDGPVLCPACAPSEEERAQMLVEHVRLIVREHVQEIMGHKVPLSMEKQISVTPSGDGQFTASLMWSELPMLVHPTHMRMEHDAEWDTYVTEVGRWSRSLTFKAECG